MGHFFKLYCTTAFQLNVASSRNAPVYTSFLARHGLSLTWGILNRLQLTGTNLKVNSYGLVKLHLALVWTPFYCNQRRGLRD